MGRFIRLYLFYNLYKNEMLSFEAKQIFMTYTKSGKSYKIRSIWIKINLQYWYFYEDWQSCEVKDYDINFCFLCFVLHFSLVEIVDNKKYIGFGRK